MIVGETAARVYSRSRGPFSLSPGERAGVRGTGCRAQPTVQSDRLDFPSRFTKVMSISNAGSHSSWFAGKPSERPVMKSKFSYSIRVVVLEVLSLVVFGGFLLAQTSADKEAA